MYTPQINFNSISNDNLTRKASSSPISTPPIRINGNSNCPFLLESWLQSYVEMHWISNNSSLTVARVYKTKQSCKCFSLSFLLQKKLIFSMRNTWTIISENKFPSVTFLQSTFCFENIITVSLLFWKWYRLFSPLSPNISQKYHSLTEEWFENCFIQFKSFRGVSKVHLKLGYLRNTKLTRVGITIKRQIEGVYNYYLVFIRTNSLKLEFTNC